MENTAFLHLPRELAFRDPRLFWLLVLELYRSELLSDCDNLIDTDWSEMTEGEDAQDIASRFVGLAFSKDDLPRVQSVSEGFSPDTQPLFFQRLRSLAKTSPQSKLCLGWMQSQLLIGKGYEGFKQALTEGLVELARKLHTPTAAEAEAVFYDHAGILGKEALGVLLFANHSLAGIKPFAHAVRSGASEEALCFFAWKLEEAVDKSHLRNPNGDENILGELLSAALCKKQFALAKKLIDWNHSLGFERFEPKSLAAPWDGDATMLKLDGNALTLTPSDFACLYAHESFAKTLGLIKAPAPSMQKVLALIGAFARKLESRKPGHSASWSAGRQFDAESIASSVWPKL